MYILFDAAGSTSVYDGVLFTVTTFPDISTHEDDEAIGVSETVVVSGIPTGSIFIARNTSSMNSHRVIFLFLLFRFLT